MIDGGLAFVRRHLDLIVPILLIVLGLSLGFASLTVQQSVLYTRTFTGTLPEGNATLSLPFQQPLSYVQVNVAAGSCPLQLYPANETGALLFNDTGALPTTSIGCNDRSTAVDGDTVALILVNPGPTSVPYTVDVQAVLIQTPLDWLALPAMAVALAGLLAFVPRFILRETLRFRDEFGENRKEK